MSNASIRVRSIAAVLRGMGAVVSPAGARARLSIMLYHRVLAAPDPLFPEIVDACRFEQEVALLAQGFNVLPLSEAVARLENGTLPANAVCITFDDGYRDNHDIALPILAEYGTPATFFVSTGYLDGGRMWNDTVIEAIRHTPGSTLDLGVIGLGHIRIDDVPARRSAIDRVIGELKYCPAGQRESVANRLAGQAGHKLPDDLMMTSVQVRHLASAGMEVGAHTLTHPILAKTDRSRALSEIAGSKSRLESIIGQEVKLFAYPNGKPEQDYLAEHVDMVKASGFRAAVSTSWGSAKRGSDLFQLPRFTPWDREPSLFGLRLLGNALRRHHTVVSG